METKRPIECPFLETRGVYYTRSGKENGYIVGFLEAKRVMICCCFTKTRILYTIWKQKGYIMPHMETKGDI